MVAPRATRQHKRHGTHQKRTRPFMKVYSPYLPLAMILASGLIFSVLWQPRSHRNVLAYATSMSTSGLLSSTNQQRANNGKTNLKINSKLASAAQAKANDMVKRDYWSHNTPDGNPPWVFINNAGYNYKTAGENLAYGFLTSEDTVTGWMKSAAHKANILNSSYSEVGFGVANSDDFQNNGEQTVVVAMYGSPQVLSATVSNTNSTPAAASKSATAQNTPATAPASKTDSKAKQPAAVATTQQKSNTAVVEPTQASVSKLAVLTKGAVPWVTTATTLVIVIGFAVLVTRHSLALHRWLRKGERYVLHHALFDVTLVSLISLAFVVSSSAGIVR